MNNIMSRQRKGRGGEERIKDKARVTFKIDLTFNFIVDCINIQDQDLHSLIFCSIINILVFNSRVAQTSFPSSMDVS